MFVCSPAIILPVTWLSILPALSLSVWPACRVWVFFRRPFVLRFNWLPAVRSCSTTKSSVKAISSLLPAVNVPLLASDLACSDTLPVDWIVPSSLFSAKVFWFLSWIDNCWLVAISPCWLYRPSETANCAWFADRSLPFWLSTFRLLIVSCSVVVIWPLWLVSCWLWMLTVSASIRPCVLSRVWPLVFSCATEIFPVLRRLLLVVTVPLSARMLPALCKPAVSSCKCAARILPFLSLLKLPECMSVRLLAAISPALCSSRLSILPIWVNRRPLFLAVWALTARSCAWSLPFAVLLNESPDTCSLAAFRLPEFSKLFLAAMSICPPALIDPALSSAPVVWMRPLA